jgi:hypothetical protein
VSQCIHGVQKEVPQEARKPFGGVPTWHKYDYSNNERHPTRVESWIFIPSLANDRHWLVWDVQRPFFFFFPFFFSFSPKWCGGPSWAAKLLTEIQLNASPALTINLELSTFGSSPRRTVFNPQQFPYLHPVCHTREFALGFDSLFIEQHQQSWRTYPRQC